MHGTTPHVNYKRGERRLGGRDRNIFLVILTSWVFFFLFFKCGFGLVVWALALSRVVKLFLSVCLNFLKRQYNWGYHGFDDYYWPFSLFFLHHVIFVFTLCASLRNTLVFLLYLQLYHLPTPDNAKKELPSLPLLWTELFSFYFIFLSFISFHKFDTFGGSSKQNILFSILLLINNGWVGQVFLFTWKEWEFFFFFFWVNFSVLLVWKKILLFGAEESMVVVKED